MPWFANGVDAADGDLSLRFDWLHPWRGMKLHLDWDIAKSQKLINRIIDKHRELSEATGGRVWVPPTWRFLRDLATPHPLGGCNMGPSWDKGVVDHTGEVFGYRGLFVLDAAVVPEAIGLNPSRTITALAERNVNFVLDRLERPRPTEPWLPPEPTPFRDRERPKEG